MKCYLAGALLAFAALTASAATRLENLVAKPNPAERQVEIEVTVDRGQFDKQGCDVQVAPGDGSAPTRLSFGVADARTKSVRHTYQKDGAYTVRATAGSGCTGTRSVSVLVGAALAPAAVAPILAEPKPQAPLQAGCPAGWYLVPESVQGGRYSCRPNLPAQALKCEGGASYFAEGGVIGCR